MADAEAQNQSSSPSGSLEVAEFSAKMTRCIELGLREKQKMRHRLAILMVSLAALGWVLEVFVLDPIAFKNVCSDAFCFSREDLGFLSVSLADTWLFLGRFVILGLAPLVDDIRLTRCVLLIDAAAAAARAVEFFLDRKDDMKRYEGLVLGCIFVCLVIRAVFLHDVARMQALMWSTLAILVGTFTIVNSVLACAGLFGAGSYPEWVSHHDPWWINSIPRLVIIYIACKPNLRRKMQTILMRLFEARAYRLAAAGIAGLVGDGTAEGVLASARARFRVIDLSSLTAEDLADNQPNPALYSLSQPARLSTRSSCDAFVSHSWHDDAAAKWKALQHWRSSFVLQHGREPHVWIDKCCIDQTNIDVDLQCLPIFVSGCSTMVVLAGNTYLSRMWCIVELFTFAHMGQDLGRIEFIPVLRTGTEKEDSHKIEQDFSSFDAVQCSCYSEEDKKKMLRIFYAAYGSLPDFSRAVQTIFDKTGWVKKPFYGP